MRAVDIYERYNAVYNWATLKSNVDAVYVKGTDGAGDAVVKPDNYVRRCHMEAIPVGLYHFAQKTPSPRVQANVLTNAVQRLHAVRLPPALDLENSPGLTWTAAEARQFAFEFQDQLRRNGFPTSTLYANRSMLDSIRPDQWLPATVYVWLAEYGPNDGRWHKPVYQRTRIDMHQFTSKGTIGGITGWVDVNEIHSTSMIKGVDDVALKDEMIAMWNEEEKRYVPTPADVVIGNGHNYARGAAETATRAVTVVAELKAEVAELKRMLSGFLGTGVTLGATGEIVVKPTPPAVG